MPQQNALGYLGMGIQSAEGTPQAPLKFFPWQTLAMPETIKMGTYRNGYNKDLSIAAKLGQYSEITFKTFLYPDCGAILLCSALGAVDTKTGAGDPYTHTMPLNDRNMKYFSIEGSMANGDLIQRVPDCLIDKLTLNLVGGALVDVECSIKGRQAVRQSSAATVAFEADRPLSFLDGTLTLTGLDLASADVTELKIEIMNGIKGRFPVGAFAPRYLGEGREFAITGKSLWADDKLVREINWGSASGTTAVSAPTYLAELNLVLDLGGTPDHRITIDSKNIEMEMGQPNWDVNAAAALVDLKGKVIRGATLGDMFTATALNAYATAYQS